MIWDDDADLTAKVAALPAAKALPPTLLDRLGNFQDPEASSGFADAAQAALAPALEEIAKPGFLDRTWRGLKASARAGYLNAPLMGTEFTLEQQYAPLVEAVNRGRDPRDMLPNPYTASMLSGFQDGALPEPRGLIEDKIWQRMEELRRTNPGAAGNLPKSRDELLELVHAEQRTAEDYAAQLAETSGGPINRVVTPFVGQAIGQMADPENIMALALGGPASQGLVRTFLTEGAINAGVTGLTLPFDMRQRQERGRALSLEHAGEEVLGAFLIGGSIGTGAKLLERALGHLASPEARAGDDVPPSVRAAATATEDAVHRAQDNPFADGDQGRDDHRRALLATTRALDDANPAGLPAEGQNIGRAASISLEAAQRKAGFQIQSRDPRTVETDAATMQYKGGADDQGVTDRLAGVKDWDPAKAGLSLWYERADGKVIVADGHQRLGLAKSISEERGEAVPYFGVTYREADGVTAQQMRAIAALKNIAEGSGSAVDAARVLRDAPEGITQLPPRSPLVRQARDLIALGNDAWGMVVNGHASERDGAIVGRHVQDPAMQAAILSHLSKDSPDTAGEAEIFVRQALAAGAAQEIQEDMFGSFLKADLVLPHRVKILANALKQLRRDKALFSTLTARAGEIKAAGNRLNMAENEARQETAAKAFATIAALAERKGPISNALQQAAEAAAKGGDRRAATQQFLKDVRGRLESGELDRDIAGGSVSDVQPEPAPAPVSARDGADGKLEAFTDPVTKPEAFQQQTKDLAQELAPAPEGEKPSPKPEGETAPQFGAAQPEMEALARLPQDAEFPAGDLFGKGEDSSITVKDARAQLEQEARAVERLRGCVERGE